MTEVYETYEDVREYMENYARHAYEVALEFEEEWLPDEAYDNFMALAEWFYKFMKVVDMDIDEAFYWAEELSGTAYQELNNGYLNAPSTQTKNVIKELKKEYGNIKTGNAWFDEIGA